MSKSIKERPAPEIDQDAVGASLNEGWVTIRKASEMTGLSKSFLYERTGARSALLCAESATPILSKWYFGRKLVNLGALFEDIESCPEAQSRRGRQPAA